MADISAANAVVTLTIPGIFNQPVTLAGYSAENVFDTEEIDAAEILMGVDGVQSGGFVNVPIPQRYHLQADSPSNIVFDTWFQTEKANQATFVCQGLILLQSIGTKWTMNNCLLRRTKPLPDAEKILRPRTFTISWESIIPSASPSLIPAN